MIPWKELSLGFSMVLSDGNIWFLLLGTFFGTAVGAMPGLGASTGVAVLLPIIFGMAPLNGILMLIGVYTGATFGGAVTSILLNTPGTPAAALTAEEGYKLTKKGKGGPAISIAALSSFVGLVVSAILLILFAPVLVDFALSFSAAEYASLIIVGLSTLAFIGSGSIMKAFISATIGFFLAVIGMDPLGGYIRFTFGSSYLIDGVDFVIVAMGIFAVGEIFINVEKNMSDSIVKEDANIDNIFPTWDEVKSCSRVYATSPIIGFFTGILPAAGQTIAAFMSYIFAQKTSRNPELYGTGILEGVAASEAGNSSSCGGALLPGLTLGIPGSNTTAMILSALVMFGIRPGPLMFTKNPDVAWGIIVSLFFAAVFLFIQNGPLMPYVSKLLLALPYSWIYPIILLFVITGAFAVVNHVFNIFMLIGFGLLGYVMQKLDLPRPPLLLALVLGPMFESSIRQAIKLGNGSFVLFYTRPIPLVLLGLTVFMMFSSQIFDLFKKLFGTKK